MDYFLFYKNTQRKSSVALLEKRQTKRTKKKICPSIQRSGDPKENNVSILFNCVPPKRLALIASKLAGGSLCSCPYLACQDPPPFLCQLFHF